MPTIFWLNQIADVTAVETDMVGLAETKLDRADSHAIARMS